jgi:hypothetical protein
MQLCVMIRTILGRILSFDRILSDILLLKFTLLEVKVVKHYFYYFFKIKSRFFLSKRYFWALLEFLAFLKFPCLVTLVVLNSQLSVSAVVSVTQLKLFANVSAVVY